MLSSIFNDFSKYFVLYKHLCLCYNIKKQKGGNIMTIGERIKYFRKEILKIKSSDEFAQKINMSGSNLRNIENNVIKVTKRVINDISNKYNVNIDWLLHGEGEIYKSESISEIDIILKKYNLSEIETQILKNYLDMNETQRKIFTEVLFQLTKQSSVIHNTTDNDNNTPQTLAASSSEIKSIENDNTDLSIPALINYPH